MSYYLCKVNLIDPSTDKVSKTQILVESTGVTESEAKVTEHLQGAGEAFEVTEKELDQWETKDCLRYLDQR